MQAFRNRLAKREKHLGKWARRERVEAYRVYDRDIPEFPYQVDRYRDNAVLALVGKFGGIDEEEEQSRLQQAQVIVAEVLNVEAKRVFVKQRQRQKGSSQYERLQQRGVEIDINEAGLRYIVNLSDYLDTGLYLDHRPTRTLVRSLSQGKRVLNLFAYTGSFSVAAAAGGAAQIVTVDLSNTYLKWAGRNWEKNPQPKCEHHLLREDVQQFLVQELERPRRYDLIVLDPPSFSNSKKMSGTMDIQRDHAGLISKVMRLLDKDGALLFSTNRRGFKLDEERLSAFAVEDITRQTTPPDFERVPAHRAYWLRKK